MKKIQKKNTPSNKNKIKKKQGGDWTKDVENFGRNFGSCFDPGGIQKCH